MAQTKEYHKQYRLDHKEETKQYYLDHKEEMKAYSKKYHLALYGLTDAEYNAMFEAQEGRCLICGTRPSELKKPLFIDHNHGTGKVRGLLCNACNRGIGMLQDDIYLVAKALEYLQNAA
jgi:hypothetical protein